MANNDRSVGNENAKTLPPELIAFAARKEAIAWDLAARFNAPLPPVIWAFFVSARHGHWPEVARFGEELRNLPLPPGLPRPNPAVTCQVWSAIMEIYMAFAQFALGEPKYAFSFGHGILGSIPPGSIYFGGTDAGRGLVTALSRSHETGDPFFTLTQNALGDRPYLRYLQELYGDKIFVPTESDLEKAWDEYRADLEERKKKHQLRPGEVIERVDGRIQCSNAIGVMRINGALAKLIFQRNPDREFFVEESFPLDWMYPHLAPHGLIMALRRHAPADLSAEIIEQDRRFWRERLKGMIGDWLQPETSVRDICAFAEKVWLRRDLDGFRGDVSYITSEPARAAFSKLRSAIAGVYVWRAEHASDPAERERLNDTAHFALRQAWALDPHSPEVVFRCVSHLMTQRRPADALLVAQTASKLSPQRPQFEMLVGQLDHWLARNGRGQMG